MVVLAACQTAPPTSPADNGARWYRDGQIFSPQIEALRASSNWQYSAKVGLTINGQSEQANLIWKYHDQSNQLRLFGPLGSGTVKLSFDEYGVQLIDNKGRIYTGDAAAGRDAQQLLTEVVGWPLPINALAYWLFVQPAPGSRFEYQKDNGNKVTALRQLGWQIEYLDYRDYAGQLLPRKITASRAFADPSLGEVKVRLISKAWQW